MTHLRCPSAAPLWLAVLWASAAQAGCPADGLGGSPTAPVARLGGVTITQAELDASLVKERCALRIEMAQRLASLREQSLMDLVDRRLLKAEAARRGYASIGALAAEVVSAVKTPSEAEARTWFLAHRADFDPSVEFNQARVVLTAAAHQAAQEGAVEALVVRLRAQADLKILLEPMRLPVEAVGPSLGPADAPITLVEFADFEYPFCAEGRESLDAVIKKYGPKLRVVHRDFPLDFHEHAEGAAVAARCADAQGKFWALRARLFMHQDALAPAALRDHAKAVGLDLAAYDVCVADPKVVAAVRADAEAGATLGVDGTPAFFINGIKLGGAQPPSAFAEIIDRELARLAR